MNYKIISVGIFFDGTGNNGLNAGSSEMPAKNNESYLGNVTNIYKMFSLFNGDEKIYVEGIGTFTGSEDSDSAMATCKNPSGLSGYSSGDKLEKALAFARKIMSEKSGAYDFYIYGFSRGAMLARNFCHELLREFSDFSGKNIRIKFLGMFDTVESAAFNNYNVAILPETERALHICALNECRYFFPLTGISEDAGEKNDSLHATEHSVWKEIFVPGAHADVGGGYLEGPQSVYISPNFKAKADLFYYIESIKESAMHSGKTKIWNYLLEDYGLEHGGNSLQAYVTRDWVHNELSKVYGKLMIAESNEEKQIFRTDFSGSDFEIDVHEHIALSELSEALENYVQTLSPDTKPEYHYGKLADYTHISANFGLYHPALLMHPKHDAHAEFINSGLNVPGHSDDYYGKSPLRPQSEIHHIEDSVVDYAYGTNIPNNDHWKRTILIKESFYNKC